MKKVIIALFLGLALSVSSYAATPSEPTNPGIIERITGSTQDNPTRVYILVRYASRDGGVGTNNAPTLAAGSAVIWDLISDDGVTIKTTTTSGDPAFAGIVTTAILSAETANTSFASDDNGKRNWGYIQTYGPVTAKVVAGGTNANAAGNFFITSRDEGAITTAETAIGTASTDILNAARISGSRGGIFYNAGDGTSTTATVFVKSR